MTIRFVVSLLLVFALSWWIGARFLQQPGTPDAVATRSAPLDWLPPQDGSVPAAH